MRRGDFGRKVRPVARARGRQRRETGLTRWDRGVSDGARVRTGCADDARVGPRERVGLLCARRAGAECGAGLRRWAGADWAARVRWAGLEALREWAGAEKGLGPCGRRMGWAVGVLGPGLVSLLGLDSFSNFFSYF